MRHPNPFLSYISTEALTPAVLLSGQSFSSGRPQDGVRLLEDAFRTGDHHAGTALAKRILRGHCGPVDPSRALDILRSCADAGEPDAQTQLATLHANGAWTPKDWGNACEYLLRGADMGSLSARGQILALTAEAALEAGYPRPSDGGETWRRLMNAIDFPKLLGASAREVALDAPRIRVAKSAATPRVCDWLVAKGLGKFQASMMFDGQKSAFDAARTCSDFKFDIVDGDCVLAAVRDRVSALTTIPAACFEPPQIFHYAVGQEIKAHFDSLRAGGRPYGASGDYAGDRIVTFLLYLNDDYDGGELVFPKVNFRHRGAKGDGVYFASVDAAGTPDRSSLHAALPVTRGEKYILSQWIHDRPFAA